MDQRTVLLARVLAFFETASVTPRGGVFFPDMASALIAKYDFQKVPKTFEEWNDPNGAQFIYGKAGEIIIDKLIFWQNGITCETRAGTDESQKIILEILEWGKGKFGINYKDDTVKQWGYVSDVLFHSSEPLLSTKPLENLAAKVTEEMTKILKEPLQYRPIGFLVGHDPLVRRYARASFTIQRRAETPFSENIYFSEAPLPTQTHFALLEQFEGQVSAAR